MSDASFKQFFLAVSIAVLLIGAAIVVNGKRPPTDTHQPSAQFVRATGKCAECHRHETSAVVNQFEHSKHAASGLSCLDCHRPAESQEVLEHKGFQIAKTVTAQNCRACHTTEYEQFLMSRHGAPAWAAVTGTASFTADQIAFAEKFHPGAVIRPPNALALLEGEAAIQKGCASCHSIGKPNPDGSIGSCTQCHSRHSASVALARSPQTCGQCHMGPDHSQIEIFNESKHGALFAAQRGRMNLEADPKKLTTHDMPVPTCATCHMSGLEGMKVTHDVTERLSFWLFADISKKRPTYLQGQANMKSLCLKCHAATHVDRFYAEAEAVVDDTNTKMLEAKKLMDQLRKEGLLSPQPFDETIDFVYFDLWHYFGRTAKHGAFMGGADFVQWHGNYEILLKMTELKQLARELRARGKH